MKDYILNHLAAIENCYGVCGIIDWKGRIYPLGSDTKVISTIFEGGSHLGAYGIRTTSPA
jgi:hypothetical protein